MKQSLEYSSESIKKVMNERHGLKNIALNDVSNIVDTISNILYFLKLERILEVQDAGFDISRSQVRFSIIASANINIAEFQNAIKIFQEHLKQQDAPKSKKTFTETIVEEIKNFIATIPANEYEIIFQTSNIDENVVKVNAGLPKYWYSVSPSDVAHTKVIIEHFKSVGYQVEGGSKIYNQLFAFTRKKKMKE